MFYLIDTNGKVTSKEWSGQAHPSPPAGQRWELGATVDGSSLWLAGRKVEVTGPFYQLLFWGDVLIVVVVPDVTRNIYGLGSDGALTWRIKDPLLENGTWPAAPYGGVGFSKTCLVVSDILGREFALDAETGTVSGMLRMTR